MPELSEQQSGGQVPVIECFKQAWQFLRQNWQGFLPAAAITGVLSQVGVALVILIRPTDGPGESMLTAMLWNLVAIIPAMVASLMFTAAVLRKVVRDSFVGRTGLMFGADEMRLLGVTAALTCVLLPFTALVLVVLWAIVVPRLNVSEEELNVLLSDPQALGVALENALGPTGVLAFILLSFLCFGIVAYVMVRLSMANAATIGEQRVVIFQTWKWSRGNVWRILGALVLTALPIVLFENILNSVRLQILQGVPAGSGGLLVLLAVEGATTFLMALASLPTLALGGILYKGLRPPDFVAK